MKFTDKHIFRNFTNSPGLLWFHDGRLVFKQVMKGNKYKEKFM